MENITIPSGDNGECSLQNTCVAVTSLAVTLGLITCCYCCGIYIRFVNAKNKRKVSPFVDQEPSIIVVVQNKMTTVTSIQEEDPC
jgi:hypothetical protein